MGKGVKKQFFGQKLTFFPKNHFIQNWSVIKTTSCAHTKKYIFKIKLSDCNFHQILPMYNIWYFIKRNCQEKLLKISKEEITIFINNFPLAVVCQSVGLWGEGIAADLNPRSSGFMCSHLILVKLLYHTLISTLDSPRVVNLLDMINSCFWSRPGPIQPTFLLVPAEPSVCIMSCFLVQVETESRVWHPGFRGTGHWS